MSSTVASSSDTTLRPVRVVLADDVFDVRRLLRLGLERTDRYEVVGEASDGAEAVALVGSLAPDVLVLDIAMPRLDGFEVLEQLAAAAASCRIVMLSGFGAERFADRARALGADAYVEKSGGFGQIAAALDRVCDDLLEGRDLVVVEDSDAPPARGPEPTPPPGRRDDGWPGRDLVAYVTHELAAPIAVIRGFAETLERPEAVDPELRRRAIAAIRRNAETLSQQLERFQQVRALDLGNLSLDLEPCELGSFAQETVEDLATTLDDHPASVRVGEPAPVEIDPLRIRQVLTNLVGNAARYSPDGTPITVTVDRAADHAVLAVLDEGPGIPAGEREAVFEKFTQLDRSRGGMGLGLYLARGIARAHGGELTAGEAPGGGARLELLLPLEDGRQADDVEVEDRAGDHETGP